MKISLNWLKDFTSLNYSADSLEEKLTDLGLECKILSENYKFSNKVVLGKVKDVSKHPNADKLNICLVDVGESESLSIVCGAPNVKKNILVAVALVGSVIGKENFKISKTKIRGETSLGMICSGKELGLSDDHDGIMIINSSHSLGTPMHVVLSSQDYLLDIDLTPNRGDCLGHLGVAREISIFNAKPLKLKKIKIDSNAFSINDKVKIKILNSEGCPRYCARVIEKIKVCDSPEWLVKKLNSIGQKSINNVVDAANFILHDLGHPLHTFDLDSIKGKIVNVRYATNKEKILALDNNEYKLTNDDIVIADSKGPMALAGIIGGLNSHVTENTTNILIESAYFNPINIRKSSKQKGLSTEASKRFERDTDFSILEYAMDKAAILIQEIAGGNISKDFIDLKLNDKKENKIIFNVDSCNKFLGSNFKEKDIFKIFDRLSIKNNKKSYGIECIIPLYRNDLYREVDLFEEVARVHGYNNFKSKGSFSIPYKSLSINKQQIEKNVRKVLSNRGFNEHYSNSLYSEKDISLYKDKKAVELLNPLNVEMSFVRNNLLAGLLKAVSYNEKRGHRFLKLFEIGSSTIHDKKTYNKSKEIRELSLIWTLDKKEHWKHPEENDIYSIKAEVKYLLSMLNFSNINFVLDSKNSTLLNIVINDSDQIGSLSQIDDSILDMYDIKNSLLYCNFNFSKINNVSKRNFKYSMISNFPAINRDISILINKSYSYDDVENLISLNGGKYLQSINLFDIYTDKKISSDKHSLLFSLKFGSNDRTLKDKEVDKVINHILNSLKDKFKVIQR